MKERAGDPAPSRARGRFRRAVDVANKSEGVVAAGRNDGRIVELVATQETPLSPSAQFEAIPRLAIAERHPALLETGLAPAGPPSDARRQRRRRGSAQRHIAPTFAMHRARLCEMAQTLAKARRRREPPGVQFRIAARKPAQIAIGRGRQVGERREKDDLGPCRPPSLHEMRVDERERRVVRKRDPLRRRPDGGGADAGEAKSRSPASSRTRAQSTCVSTKSAIASSRASSASVSPACTRPRWRSGSATLSFLGSVPRTGIPIASIASTTSRR